MIFLKKSARKICIIQKKVVTLHPILRLTELNSIQLSQLEVGKHEFQFALGDDFFHSVTPSEILGGMVDVQAKLNLRETDYDLCMSLRGEVQVTCDRCLDPMSVTVDLDEDMEVEDEVQTLDLPWLAYETIVVNLPLVHSHQPGGCNPAMDSLLQDHLCAGDEEPE